MLILLPIPILPVTKVGKAKPPSYSKIKLFSLIKVFPQSTEVPGKGIPPSSIKATPKFHSIKEFSLDHLEVSCALLAFIKKKNKTVTKRNFFILFNWGINYKKYLNALWLLLAYINIGNKTILWNWLPIIYYSRLQKLLFKDIIIIWAKKTCYRNIKWDKYFF